MVHFATKLFRLKNKIRKWNKIQFGDTQMAKVVLEQQLSQIQSQLEQGNDSTPIHQEQMLLKDLEKSYK